jgi:hypothetical protein
MDFRGQAGNFTLHEVGEPRQLGPVDAYSGPLHARQHAGQRQLDVGV